MLSRTDVHLTNYSVNKTAVPRAELRARLVSEMGRPGEEPLVTWSYSVTPHHVVG